MLDLGKEAEPSPMLDPALFDGVLLATDLLADERMETLLAEARLRKLLPEVSIDFFDSAARAALAAVGRASRETAESLEDLRVSNFLIKNVLKQAQCLMLCGKVI